MNVKRFTGRTSREAMQKVRQTFGDEAVVLSTKPAAEGGVEVMAMAGENIPHATDHHESIGLPLQSASSEVKEDTKTTAAKSTLSSMASSVQDDVRQLAMSTLSFQEYVRDRMLRRRQAAITSRLEPAMAPSPEAQLTQRLTPKRKSFEEQNPIKQEPVLPNAPPLRLVSTDDEQPYAHGSTNHSIHAGTMDEILLNDRSRKNVQSANLNNLTMDSIVAGRTSGPQHQTNDKARHSSVTESSSNESILSELRAMRELMKERFQTMAFIDQLHRTPGQAQMTQQLLDGGFSPALIRKMVAGLTKKDPDDGMDEMAWSAQMLQQNLNTADREPNLEDQSGIFAFVGATGVGKTTCTAKLAALFAAKHGAHNLGLITLDAYRMGAHEQLRSYGRILGVPVHIAHDRPALEDLLELLSNKKLILIDTAGMPQRDTRTRELLEMISHKDIQKLLVINASHQGDCIEDVMIAYQAHSCAGIVLSKLDETIKLGPAIDALIRHKLKLMAVTNGQRVPEDWHRLSCAALVQRAIRVNINPAYRFEPNEISLVFSSEKNNVESISTAI